MKRCRRNAFGLFFFALALLVGCGDDGGPAAPSSTTNPNRIWVESQSASPGDTVEVKVRMHIAQQILVVQIPVQITGTNCTVASVSWGDSLPVHSPEPLSYNDFDPEPLRVNMIWTSGPILAPEPIDPGDWLFATINVCISSSAGDQEILVDDYSYVGDYMGQAVLHKVGFANTLFEEVSPSPSFEGGKITVVSP